MKTESWLRIIRHLCKIDEWLFIHAGWFHNTGLWMPVYQWMHAELVVWEEYWERLEMKHECRSCEFFGPESFMGWARCQQLRVVQPTGTLSIIDEDNDDKDTENPRLSVPCTFGCILWRVRP